MTVTISGVITCQAQYYLFVIQLDCSHFLKPRGKQPQPVHQEGRQNQFQMIFINMQQ